MTKKKSKKFSATKAVKANARAAIGMPLPTRRKEGIKKAAKEKHKPTLDRILGES